MLMAVLCVAGCSSREKAKAPDLDAMEQTAEIIIMNFKDMSDEQFKQLESASDYQLNYTMMSTGLPISAEDFRSMMKAWKIAVEDCGTYVSHGKYKSEVKGDEVVLSTNADFEKRKAEITFRFDGKANLESIDVAADISTGEILKKAILNTILGMGIVFLVLILLSFLISLIKYIPGILKKLMDETEKIRSKTKEDADGAAGGVDSAAAHDAGGNQDGMVPAEDDPELIAVIAAAVAASGQAQSDGFIVRSIRRRPGNHWN